MNLDKDPSSWARVSAELVMSGSHAQQCNVMRMALHDIAELAAEVEQLRALHQRPPADTAVTADERQRVAYAIHLAFWLANYGEETGTAEAVARDTWRNEDVRARAFAQADAAVTALHRDPIKDARDHLVQEFSDEGSWSNTLAMTACMHLDALIADNRKGE